MARSRVLAIASRRLWLRLCLAAVLACVVTFLAHPADAAMNFEGQSVSLQVQSSTTAPVKPDCCAGAWYPWGWYYTFADCDAAGDQKEREIPLALQHKCPYDSYPPASAGGRHYHLYIFEAG